MKSVGNHWPEGMTYFESSFITIEQILKLRTYAEYI